MKKLSAILLSIILVLSLASCGIKNNQENVSSQTEDNGPFFEYEIKDNAILLSVSKRAKLSPYACAALCVIGEYSLEEEVGNNYIYRTKVLEEDNKSYSFKNNGYHFAFKANDIATGEYSLVICDNISGGKVVMQCPLFKDEQGNISIKTDRIKMKNSWANDPLNMTFEATQAPVWPFTNHPIPENCEIVAVDNGTFGTEVLVKWKNKDAAKAYKNAICDPEKEAYENDTEAVYEYMDGSIVISFDKNVAENNIVAFPTK